ncbi:MAG: hypothetical protein ACXWQ6_05335 [Candidatus Limnocylindrales bacterium]
MDLPTAVAGWRDFYLASAGAAAVLLGLIFVGMSLHYDLRQLDRRLVAMATESAVPFFYALLACLVMLVPAAQPWVPSGGLVVVGALGALNAGLPLVAPWYSEAVRPGAGHRVRDCLRYVLPWLTALALCATALALLIVPESALYAVGLIVLVFIALGMQSAWDVLLRRDLRPRPDD